MQNWILMAQNSKGQNLRACSQIADDNIPSLEAASLGLTMAESLCTLLAQGMGEETSGPMQPERVGMYSDSLWVLADHLRTAKEAVQKDTARLYQERRRVP